MQFASRTKPCRGETANGDRAIILEREGELLFAVVDALGHGPVADAAASLAENALARVQPGSTLDAYFEATHDALRGSRGAAMTAIRFAGDALEVAAIGNVGCRAWGMSLPIVWTAGILGHSHRGLRVGRCSRPAGARIVLFSDGISARFPIESLDPSSPALACEELLRRALDHDDATALVIDV